MVPAAHGAIRAARRFYAWRRRIHPVVGGAGVALFRSADEGEMFGARYIIGAAAMEITVGISFFVELYGIALAKHFGDDAARFSVAEPSQ